MGRLLTIERLLSMWGLAVALGAISSIAAVVSRQGWLILTNVGMLLVIFAQRGLDGWLADLMFWTGLAIC